MIKYNITAYEEENINFLNLLTDGKRKELRHQMIKFLKENEWPDSLEYGIILEFINDFFVENQFESCVK